MARPKKTIKDLPKNWREYCREVKRKGEEEMRRYGSRVH